MLFGHSRGRYAIDPEGRATQRLDDMLNVLGFDEYGHNALADRDDRPFDVQGTTRGDILYDAQGRPVLETRAYWWGDEDTEEERRQADLPNLEIRLDDCTMLTVSWYKYRFRDAYANMPLGQVIDRVADVLGPYVSAAKAHWLTRLSQPDWTVVTPGHRVIIRLDLLPANLLVSVEEPVGASHAYRVHGFRSLGGGRYVDGWHQDWPPVAAGHVRWEINRSPRALLTTATDPDDWHPLIDFDQDAFDRVDVVATGVDWATGPGTGKE